MIDGIYAFDLLVPVHPLLPGAWTCSCGATLGPCTPLRDCRTKSDAHAGCRAKAEAERTAKATAEFEAVIATWLQVCNQYADTPAVLAVLNLHQPTLGHASVECEYCERYDGMEGTEQAPWPCPTYAAVRDALDRSDVDACNDAPVKAEALPEVGSIVHLWREEIGCSDRRVTAHFPADGDVAAGLVLGRTDESTALDYWPRDFAQYLTRTHDESRTEPGSWHWPHNDDGQDAEPEPDAPAPNITINISGSVLSERDLRDAIQQEIGKAFSQTSRRRQYRL